MKPRVSAGVQVAFVIAAVATGAVVGGLSLIFQEATSRLGGLLGGFCLGMWLLCLREDGLFRGRIGRSVLIAVFCLAGFALTFIPYTRTHGMIAMISFAGATVAVLGIDCFSRAGLKEFWLYIWGESTAEASFVEMAHHLLTFDRSQRGYFPAPL